MSQVKSMVCLSLALLFLPLFGCDDAINNAATAEPLKTMAATMPDVAETAEGKLEGYVKTLTSHELGGRLTGTPGNDLATEWLCQRLGEIGVEPYENNDYRMGFMSDCYDNELCAITIHEAGGATRELVWGCDFMFSLTKSFDVDLSKNDFMLVSAEELGTQNKIVYGASPSGVSYFFFESEYFTSGTYPNAINGIREPLAIDVSPDAFAYLIKADIDKIHIENVVNITNNEVYNVVGRIKGTQSGKGVVITAHFDHMGKYGEAYFPGALDNASGTATLLLVSDYLQRLANEKLFNFDVIIAFCNDEEQHMVGSRALASALYDDYDSLIEINIDCVGVAGRENTYGLTGGICEPLTADMRSVMDTHGIRYSDKNMVMSDHVSFENYSIPSLSLIVDDCFIDIHKTTDTEVTLDYAHIARVANMVTDFVCEYGGKNYWTKQANMPERTASPTAMPVNIQEQFEVLVKRVKDGEEVHFSEELISNMPSGQQNLFTYHDFLVINEGIAALKNYGDYHLRFINRNPNSGIIYNLFYMKDRPNEGAEPETIIISFHQDTASIGSMFSVDAINGQDGYYSILEPEMKTYIGFAYENKNTVYEVDFVNTIPSRKRVSLGFSGINISSMDALKARIPEVGIAAFAKLWEEYSAQAK